MRRKKSEKCREKPSLLLKDLDRNLPYIFNCTADIDVEICAFLTC